uniref:PiggyBac transposable element-derived protein 4 n=1 Tax=Leptobrachium leishanense TaxID=445787 RepID=A0A8C5WCR5_9ANUR
MAKRLLGAEEAADVLLISDSDFCSDDESFREDSDSVFAHGESSPTDCSSDDEEQSDERRRGRTRSPGCSHGRAATTSSEDVKADPDGVKADPDGVMGVEDATSTNDLKPEPTYNWTSPNMVQPELPKFSSKPGVLVGTAGFEPMNYFQLFIDDGFLESIVQQTNLYAKQYFKGLKEELRPHSRRRQWTETNLKEMRKFWGLTLQMGIVQKPSISSYWTTECTQTTPIFPATMKRDRYQLLIKFLHFNNNEFALPRDHKEYDRLFKLRPILDHLLERFQEYYTPGQNLSIDESLLLFKGRIGFKQYVPSKRAVYGIKVYKLCESSSGYTYRFRVYTGKDSLLTLPDCPSSLSSSDKIARDLLHPLFNKGYHVYTDNFFTSVSLFRFLYSKGTGACGMIHANSVGFANFMVKKQKRGETTALRREELLAVKFTHKRDVHMLTTIHDESTIKVQARAKDPSVRKPSCLLDYNLHMGGGDRTDQMIETYDAIRKSYVWYKKLVVHLVQLSMVNAYILYQATQEKRITFLKFQESVIERLICPAENAPVVEEVEELVRLKGNHFADFLPPTEKRARPCKRCRVCTRKGQRKETRYYCPDCPTKPGLCMPTCFKIYHTVQDY